MGRDRTPFFVRTRLPTMAHETRTEGEAQHANHHGNDNKNLPLVDDCQSYDLVLSTSAAELNGVDLSNCL